MNWHNYFVQIYIFGLVFIAGLNAQPKIVHTLERPISAINQQEQPESEAALSLPLPIFAQQVNLRTELTSLLSYLARNNAPAIPLAKELQEYLNRATAFETLMDAYFFFITIKAIMHCQRSSPAPAPARLPYLVYEPISGNSLPEVDGLIENNDEQQKISVTEIIDLLERVQEDLERINDLERSDKKEILNILLARQQHLNRKLKELGVLHYSQQSSFWNSSLPWAFAGLCLGISIISLCLASINEDNNQFNIQIPSLQLLSKNLKKMQNNEQAPAQPNQAP